MKIRLLLLASVCLSLNSASADVAADFVLGGLPKTNGLVSDFNITVITNVAYVAGYDETRKDPAWVVYKLVKKKPAYKLPRPPSLYAEDDQTISKVPDNGYSEDPKDPLIGNQKWAHGHMAANNAIAKVFGAEAQLATFKMSNMCPQSPRLNSGKWKVLENREYGYSQEYGQLWTICGPIFQKHLRTLKYGVEVPSGYYKILVRKTGSKLETMAITFDYYPPTGVNVIVYLKTHLTIIRDLEKLTGLDFFSAFPKDVQDGLELAKAKTLW